MGEYKLRHIALHITNQCKGHCPYCYQNSSDRQYRHIDLNIIHKIVNDAAKANVERISLLGGDPVLYPYIMKVASTIREKNISVGVMSNSLSFSEPLQEVTRIIDVYETTIHGKSEIDHDLFSNHKGSYRLLIRNLKRLSEYNVSIGIAINIVPQTKNCIYDIIKQLKNVEGINIKYVVLQRIIPYGRAEGKKEYQLSSHDMNEALEGFDRVEEEFGIRVEVEDPIPLCKIEKRFWKYMHPCEWGTSKISITMDGNVTRCGADTKHVIGNVLQQELLQIWNNAPQLKIFREKPYLSSKCKECLLLSKCGGGCSLNSCFDMENGNDYLLYEDDSTR